MVLCIDKGISHEIYFCETWQIPKNIPLQIFPDSIRVFKVQSTLVISKSMGPSKTLGDIRTSTYQICSIEEKTI